MIRTIDHFFLGYIWHLSLIHIYCDMVVLEVGLGGRFDATNVIPCPLLAVICSISLDHTAILGDTIQQIAFEKAGIIKQGGTTVAYPQSDPAAVSVLKQAAKGRENRLYFCLLYTSIRRFLPHTIRRR